MDKTQNNTHSALNGRKTPTTCIILLATVLSSGLATADTQAEIAGIIDEPSISTGALSEKEKKKQVKKEQQALAKEDRKKLKKRADKGERLAQVALGSDFAAEAQQLTFAPAAANDALSDALKWYSVAAQRGFPGAHSLDRSGVSFYPVRVVRNK